MSALVSSSEFARARKVSEQRVRQLLAAGKVAGAIRVGARWAIPADAAIRPASDIDLLIVSYRGKTWGQVRSIVDEAARPYGIPVDVIYADTLPPAVRKAMLKDARRASDL